jgi:hypothetical protein
MFRSGTTTDRMPDATIGHVIGTMGIVTIVTIILTITIGTNLRR